jgi:hypothetical protein
MTKTNNNMNLKKVFGTIQTLLIVVLIIIILLMRNCSGNSNPKPKPKEIVKTTIKYIPVNKEIPVYIPKWKEKIVIDIDTFLVNVDTNAILSDYYAKYYFVDTLSLDTLGYVLVEDTVTQNKIASRKVNYKVNIPKITIEKTIYVNEREFYYGLGLAGNPKQLNYLGAEMLYRTKKKQAYGLGVGVNQNFQPVITGRIFWKIGK